jgi:hypothetical protein
VCFTVGAFAVSCRFRRQALSALERPNIKLAIPGQRELNLLGHRGRTCSMYE